MEFLLFAGLYLVGCLVAWGLLLLVTALGALEEDDGTVALFVIFFPLGIVTSLFILIACVFLGSFAWARKQARKDD